MGNTVFIIGDLADLLSTIQDSWLTPILLFMIAFIALRKLVFNGRDQMGLTDWLTFALTVTVGLVIYFGPTLFQSFAENASEEVEQGVNNW